MDFRGIFDDSRHSNAAFVHRTLFTSQRKIAAGEFSSRPTIVAEEKHERVTVQIIPVQAVQHFANTVIQIAKHCGEDATVNVVDVSEPIHVLVRSLQRTVNGVVGQIQKEGPSGIAINKVDGFARERIGQVCRFLHRLAASINRIIGVVGRFVVAHVSRVDQLAVRADVASFFTAGQRSPTQHGGNSVIRRRDEVVAFVQEAKEFVEAAPHGVILRRSTQMPFADQGCGVSNVVQHVGERLLIQRQPRVGVFVLIANRIKFIAKSSLIATGQQARSRRATERRCDIAIGEPHSVRSDGINVRRGNLRIALKFLY